MLIHKHHRFWFCMYNKDEGNVLARDEGKPVPDAKNVSVRVPRSWEGTPPHTEVCVGEELVAQ